MKHYVIDYAIVKYSKVKKGDNGKEATKKETTKRGAHVQKMANDFEGLEQAIQLASLELMGQCVELTRTSKFEDAYTYKLDVNKKMPFWGVARKCAISGHQENYIIRAKTAKGAALRINRIIGWERWTFYTVYSLDTLQPVYISKIS